jgi:Ala-tRNA(Pro) deacylase
MTEAALYRLLQTIGIPYERVEHPPVFTYEEAEAQVPALAGVHTKNLFLRDGKGRRHFLVVVGSQARVDLRGLASELGVAKLGMASPERLQRYLGVTPGAVTLLGVVNAEPGEIEIIIDTPVWHADQPLHCHPLVNTATLSVPVAGLQQLLDTLGHTWQVLRVPCREDD